MNAERVRIHTIEVLSKDWHTLRKTTFDYLRSDGQWQRQSRETYDRGHGATILLYDSKRHTVLLTRQFRFPAYASGHHGFLIETAAGLLEDASPEQRIRAEVEEETGYRISKIEKIMEVFMSPGSVTEKLHFFVGEYQQDQRVSNGGGIAEEGEDIEVIEYTAAQAIAMIASGDIVDGKTILLLQYMQLNLLKSSAQMILIAGPYRSSTNDAPEIIQCNEDTMETYALSLYEAGHIPVLGEWLALPLTQLAGKNHFGEAIDLTIFHSHAKRLLTCCDAVLRIGGVSEAADTIVELGRRMGKVIYASFDEIPAVQ